MSDRHDITLVEASGPTPNPPELLSELRDLILTMFPDAAEAGTRWFTGKSEQEIAKAAEIRASALEKLGRLELERQKLLHERDAVLLKAQTDREHDRLAHAEKMYELKTERLKAVVEALKAVRETGTYLTAKTAKQITDLIASSLEE